MALQILPRTPGLGDILGQSLGQGIAGLAQGKLEALNYERSVQGLRDMGLPDADARFIARLPQKYQLEALTMANPQQGQQEQQQEMPMEQLQQLLSGGQQQQQQPQDSGLQSQLQGLSRLPLSEMLSQLGGLGNQLGMQQQQPMQQEMAAQQQQAQPQQAAATPKSQKPVSSLVGAKRSTQAGEQKINPAHQKAINANNAPYIKDLNEQLGIADKMEPILRRMKQLKATGKVANRSWDKIPNQLRNKETIEFMAKADRLAALQEQQSGASSDQRLKFTSGYKPNVTQDSDTQDNLIDAMLKEVDTIKQKGRIRDELIATNDYNEPKGLSTLVNREFDLFERNNKNSSGISPSFFDELKSVKDAKDGDRYEDETSGQIAVRKGGKWQLES